MFGGLIYHLLKNKKISNNKMQEYYVKIQENALQFSSALNLYLSILMT